MYRSRLTMRAAQSRTALLDGIPRECFFGDACPDELPDQSGWQGLRGIEMQGALGLLVAANVVGERCECSSAERKIGTALCRCNEARKHDSGDTEGGHSVAEAFLSFRDDRPDGLPKIFERLTPIFGYGVQVRVDGIEIRDHGLSGSKKSFYGDDRHNLSVRAGLSRICVWR